MFARQNPGKRRVRFPDEVVFEDEIKEQDGMAVMDMLRRASIDIDINRINSAGERVFNKNSSSLCIKDGIKKIMIKETSPSRVGILHRLTGEKPVKMFYRFTGETSVQIY